LGFSSSTFKLVLVLLIFSVKFFLSLESMLFFFVSKTSFMHSKQIVLKVACFWKYCCHLIMSLVSYTLFSFFSGMNFLLILDSFSISFCCCSIIINSLQKAKKISSIFSMVSPLKPQLIPQKLQYGLVIFSNNPAICDLIFLTNFALFTQYFKIQIVLSEFCGARLLFSRMSSKPNPLRFVVVLTSTFSCSKFPYILLKTDRMLSLLLWTNLYSKK